ncbi:hypothetical protein EOD41_11905 [Mucilaginibacter limnophilus]|uniref:Fibronectin type-III domain-containing protein n=1 Tax=Mucilaginibacter limnophilus TaxID=1932778 RepID=A0A3S2UNU0_9SPHI|nr:hypothetical protein [Mucilaginibacter limnophilus]RVU00694.1 hypothetical protein EOD41_11905 [Mucilaginibacter limnophilus]
MKKGLYTILTVLIIVGCGKGKKNEASVAPGKAELKSPANNEVCEQGDVISNTESKITLIWAAASNTDSYEVNVKNLKDGTTTSAKTTDTKVQLTLSRNTPFSWSVTSRASGNAATATSNIWKFYNSGPSVVNYAPFPAEIVSPEMNEKVNAANAKVTLVWTGKDVDNDISHYDLYWSESTSPALFKSNITQNQFDVDVTTAKTYYWQIITHDKSGNTSVSGVFSFVVK